MNICSSLPFLNLCVKHLFLMFYILII
uniref:Uncharacterized protein n=1 Tax=Anguilla anguilla TaxID=7936 RepID=A0A0E9URS8_ANGAN